MMTAKCSGWCEKRVIGWLKGWHNIMQTCVTISSDDDLVSGEWVVWNNEKRASV